MITDAQFRLAAASLAVDVASIRAVDQVESRGAGFDVEGRVKILFEPHIFHSQSGGKFGKSHPRLSYPSWLGPKSTSYQRDQHDVLREARALDEAAAIKACSWGRYQIMGFNHQACGLDLAAFETAMRSSEGAHLDAFVRLIRTNRSWHMALKARDWHAFAELYNGPEQEQGDYEGKLRRAYEAAAKGK